MPDPIVIVDYDPAWPLEFERVRDRAAAALGDVALAVEHVGSTAVPGLAAKPVIDLVVVVEPDRVQEAVERLSSIGYVHEGTSASKGGKHSPLPRVSPDIIITCTSRRRTARSCAHSSPFATACGRTLTSRRSTRR